MPPSGRARPSERVHRDCDIMEALRRLRKLRAKRMHFHFVLPRFLRRAGAMLRHFATPVLFLSDCLCAWLAAWFGPGLSALRRFFRRAFQKLPPRLQLRLRLWAIPPALLRAKRNLLLASAACLLLGLTAAALVPIVSGRTSPPDFGRQAAWRAYEQAERRGAPRWAPRQLAAAKKALAQGLFEYRRQSARFLPLRNFEVARLILSQAEQRSWEAARGAVNRRKSAQERAQMQVHQATELVAIGRDFGMLMPLSLYERTLLARAQVRLQEAKQHWREGHYADAEALATESETVASRVGEACAERAGRYADTQLVERWRHMVDETVAWSRRTGQTAIVVSKAAHSLTLYRGGMPNKRYRADIGSNSIADKTASGDQATPEGKYRIVAKKDVGQSHYHRALLLDYPTAEDLAVFRRLRRSGKIRASAPGGQIEIHGEGGRQKDWTRGCVAIANPEMDELFNAVSIGTPVVIVGSHGDGGPFLELVERYRAAKSEVIP